MPAALEQIGQRLRVARLEVARIVFAQHADVAGNARGQYRRAAEHRFHHHVRTALDAAGVHQHMGALNVPARGRMRLPAQPAVMRAGGGRGPGLLAQGSIERLADVVDEKTRFTGQQLRRLKQGLR